MKSQSKFFALVPFVLLANSAVAQSSEADLPLAIPVGSQSADLRQTLLMPERGQSMASVRERLGEPEQTHTVGKPAITTWKYKDMTVYFEDSTVLRAVVHLQPERQPTSLAREG